MGSQLSTAQLLNRRPSRSLYQRLLAGALGVTLAFGIGIVPATASAEPTDPDAKAKFASGISKFENKDFDGAIADFEAGYAIESDPLFLFAWAQAEFNKGDCREAVKLYNKFIAEDVPQSAKDQAKEAIVVCAERMADQPVDPDPLDDPVDDPVEDDPFDDPEDDPVNKPPPKNDGKKKWYLDPVGDALVATGVVAAGVGIGLIVGGEVLDGKPQAPSYAEHVDRVERVQTLRIAGAVTAGIGGALIIGGAIRWALVARESKSPSVGLLYGRGLTGLQLQGRF